MFGRTFGTEFKKKDESIGSSDFEKIVGGYGVDYRRAQTVNEFSRALKEAITSDTISVVEAIVEREYPRSGIKEYGSWDLSVPFS